MKDGSTQPLAAERSCIGAAPFFYGWVLVAIGFVTMAVGVNARTAFSLLFPAMLDEFGWDRGLTAGWFSFGFLVSAVVTPFVGRLMDQRGPRLVVEIGVFAMGVGLLLGSPLRQPRQLYLALGAGGRGGRRGQLPRLYRAIAVSDELVRAAARIGAEHRVFRRRHRLDHDPAVV